MPKKRNVSASKTADEFAELALKHLSQYSEEEQEGRISKGENRGYLRSCWYHSRSLSWPKTVDEAHG
jgi:hypothetical protein